MVELVCEVDCELLTEPCQVLVGQSGDSLGVKLVPLDNCKFGADLSLEVDDACESDGEDEFDEHEISKGAQIVVLVFFVLMSDEEVDEDVKEFCCNDDEV